MKKLLMFVMCCLMVAPAFAADKCEKYGVKGDQYLLEREKGSWKVYYCENVKDKAQKNKVKEKLVKEEKDLQLCFDADIKQTGWSDFSMSGNKVLQVKNTAIISKNINFTGNISLNEFFDKNTACYYCQSGYIPDGKDCVEDRAHTCSSTWTQRCNGNNDLTISGKDGCYVCGQKGKQACGNGDRIFVPEARVGKGSLQKNKIWECVSKKWEPRDPKVCDGYVDLSNDVKAGRAIRKLRNSDFVQHRNNMSSIDVSGNEICYEYTCDENSGWIQSGGKCVQNANYKEICEKSGGIYNEASLRCECAEINGLKVATNGHVCECVAGVSYAWNGKSCSKTTAAQQAEQRQQQQQQLQQQQQQRQKDLCAKSGGEYKNNVCTCRAEKNLVLRNGACECESADYKFENANTGCVEKDESVRRRNCEAASGTYWNGSMCICNETDMVFIGGKCQKSADAVACEAAADTIWNSVTKVCSCKKAGFEWNGVACEETAESIAAREEANRAQRITKSSATIADASKKLDDIMAGLKISVWKTAEGKFNTARLASDSIAGVVLGTAGGLITSHVVKKNQVKKGFEDIQCTVGGQKVADWGDEFTVGIR